MRPRQLDLGGGRVLLEVLDALRARDRHDVLALVQQPRERQLRRRAVELGGDLLEALDPRQVALAVSALEARQARAEVVLAVDLERTR